MNWDDLGLFQAFAGASTLRAAAAKAGISHSTLSRRMDVLEARVGTRLFVRGPRGVALTEEGTALLETVGRASDVLDEGLRTIAGAQTGMRGLIRLTVPDFVAFYGLLHRLPEFEAAYPEITFEVSVSYGTADLSRREADIAIRFVGIGQSPDDVLVGRKIAQSHACGYASRDYLSAHDLSDPDCGAVWLGWAPDEAQDWIADTPYPHLPARGAFNHAELQHHAARAGLGLSYLPIIIGDADPALVRLPAMEPKPARDIWVLSHADLRHTERLRAFRLWLGDVIRSENF